ncbi:MAG: hypothetical protein K2I91_00720, partial [Muribaculaceae bacterium]|nr:hypothetical protein [Muribaculaceae bacterium]
MRLDILSFAAVVAFASFACINIEAQEYVVHAKDVKLDIVDDAFNVYWPGTASDEHTIYVRGRNSEITHTYTDAVIALDEGNFWCDIVFLSQNPPEVGLTYIDPWNEIDSGIRLKPGVRIPDHIEYQGT